VSKIKKLAGETVLYGLGSILPRFLNFLLVPLHTTVFGPSAYGDFTFLFSYVAVFNIIFTFGMETAYFRFASKEGADERKIFNLTQTVVFVISLFFSIVFFLNYNGILDWFEIRENNSILTYIILIMFVDAIVSIPFARLRLQKRPLKFALGKLINIGLLVGLNAYLLLFSGLTPELEYVFLANLIANSFYIIFFIKELISWRPAFDRNISPSIFSYSYPIMLTGVAGMINENLSRMALKFWLPQDFYKDPKVALGIFGAAYKYSVLMNLAIQAFRYAAEPFFFAQSTEKNSPHLFARVNHYFVIVCCLLLLSVSINLDILKYFLGRSVYWEGLFIVPVLLLAYLCLGVYYNYSVWFKLTDRTYFGTIITIAGVVITVVGNYFLIPILGYQGCALVALACYFTMMMLCYWLGQKYFPIPYTIIKDFSYIIVTTALVYAVFELDRYLQVGAVISTTIHILVIVMYCVVVFFIERKNLLLKQQA
jgi:O-antigen/teichoic acid export membrane protein